VLTLKAIFIGAISAIAAILLHQTIPPLGVALGLTATYIGIWSLGRKYGQRKLKVIASLTWLVIVTRAGTFGAGQELLVQGDGVGTALLLLGAATLFIATAARN
jgi:hypothetical protein